MSFTPIMGSPSLPRDSTPDTPSSKYRKVEESKLNTIARKLFPANETKSPELKKPQLVVPLLIPKPEQAPFEQREVSGFIRNPSPTAGKKPTNAISPFQVYTNLRLSPAARILEFRFSPQKNPDLKIDTLTALLMAAVQELRTDSEDFETAPEDSIHTDASEVELSGNKQEAE